MEDGERGPWKGPGADAVPSPKTWAQTDALPSQAVPREGGGLWGLDTLQEESTRDLRAPPPRRLFLKGLWGVAALAS